MLSTGTIKTSIEGNTLIAKDEYYTTKVEVLPPDADGGDGEPIRAVVRLTTELPGPFQTMMKGHELELSSLFNPMAALGALTFDGSKVYIGSRLTIFEREDAWSTLHLPLLMIATIGSAAGILGAMRRNFSGEPSRGGDLFPHLYGPLATHLVRAVTDAPLRADGVPDLGVLA